MRGAQPRCAQLELGLQRMRMEEELHLAVALSRSVTEGTEGLAAATAKTRFVPPQVLEECAPARLYASAVASDRRAHGLASHLPGGGECAICQASPRPAPELTILPINMPVLVTHCGAL